MASPSRTHVEQWTETDQEIIESLLLVDGSSRGPAAAPAAASAAHPARPQNTPAVAQPLLRVPMYVDPASSGMAPLAVPVAFWVPTQPGQQYPAHPYSLIQPVLAAHVSAPQLSPVDTDLQDMMSEEERKAKHREVQRRFVQRKKEQMDRVRREATRLEKRHSYLQLSLEKLSLEQENSALRERELDDIPIPSSDAIERMLTEECQAAQEAFVPIPEEEYSEILRETLACVGDMAFKDPRKLDEPSKLQVMGWTGRRVIEPAAATAKNSENGDGGATLRFEISKEFPRTDPEDLASRTWERIRNPDGYRRFFSQTTLMKVVVLQHVNDDSVVIYKTIFNPHTAAVQRSVDLLCRIRMKDEHVLIARAIVVPSVRAVVRDPTGWCRALNVLGFAQAKASASGLAPPPNRTTCAFRYNASIEGSSTENLRYWLMEILFGMVRFESLLVAPLFVLAAP